jgi:hypothetical protein
MEAAPDPGCDKLSHLELLRINKPDRGLNRQERHDATSEKFPGG